MLCDQESILNRRVVETTSGPVCGAAIGEIARFLGVPYAAAPVGPLRFEKPQPHPVWSNVRDATDFGPTAPQTTRPFPGLDVVPIIGKGWEKGDDYLTANIWTPAAPASGLPVMVWIHGGGFVIGSNNVPVSDGTAFARSGVVCIAINYRLGIDGFLPIPGVPTNLGLRDILAALKWVRENARAFGGDPDNVTVFGESAGAMAIADLITSPCAKGLFRRAIVQSGHGAMTRDISVAQRLVNRLAKLLKIAPTRDGFAAASSDDLQAAIEKISSPAARIDLRGDDGREPVFGISRFIPVHGDDILPHQPLEALKQGAGSEIELLIGTNAEEMNLYLVPTGVRDKVGKWLATYLLHRSHPKARKTLRAYGMGDGKKPGQVLVDAMTDLVFRWPARRFAEEHRGRTHMYEFEWRSPMFGDQLGAGHGMELPFVFDNLAATTGPEGLTGEAAPQALADRIHALWVGFARDGSLPWNEFRRDSRHVFQLESNRSIEEPMMPCAPFLP